MFFCNCLLEGLCSTQIANLSVDLTRRNEMLRHVRSLFRFYRGRKRRFGKAGTGGSMPPALPYVGGAAVP